MKEILIINGSGGVGKGEFVKALKRFATVRYISIADKAKSIAKDIGCDQQKRERDEKDKRNQEQANVAKSIDTNVSGTMPNGDPAPKRDPNDGGDKTRVAIGVTTIGAGAAVVESVVEGTQPQETVSQQPSQQPEVKPQESEKNNEWLQQILNLFQ